MSIRKVTLKQEGFDKPTSLSLRDARPGGPAKYAWSISQDYGKNEIKLNHGQLIEIVELVAEWLNDDNWAQ